MMNYRVTRGDMRRLEQILSHLEKESTKKISLLGFSTGGSYSLLLAANPIHRNKIGSLVLFSPVYDARDVAERLHAPIETVPNTYKEWDQFYWAQFVIAFRNRKKLELTGVVLSTLRSILTDYDIYGLESKRTFYLNYIASHHLVGRSNLLNEGVTLDHLSARGNLSTITSPVYILHDAMDRIVPPDHSHRIYAELVLRGTGFYQKVLITHWLSHVVMQKTGNLPELFQIVSFVSELFNNGK
jgi:pimeloyl-ACP methyl ester carboxylesterase